MSEDTRSVPCPLRAAALSSPDTTAIVGPWRPISYDEFDKRVSAAALGLGGFEPGSRVAIYLPKDERYVSLVLAVIRAGHVACPVSDRLPPKGVTRLLESAACTALISDNDAFLRTTGTDLHELKPEPLLEGRQCGQPADIPLERPATMLFTSGSTSVPKAA